MSRVSRTPVFFCADCQAIFLLAREAFDSIPIFLPRGQNVDICMPCFQRFHTLQSLANVHNTNIQRSRGRRDRNGVFGSLSWLRMLVRLAFFIYVLGDCVSNSITTITTITRSQRFRFSLISATIFLSREEVIMYCTVIRRIVL